MLLVDFGVAKIPGVRVWDNDEYAFDVFTDFDFNSAYIIVILHS